MGAASWARASELLDTSLAYKLQEPTSLIPPSPAASLLEQARRQHRGLAAT